MGEDYYRDLGERLLKLGFEPGQGDLLPDCREPSTLGRLMARVREVWGDENAFCDPRGGWHVCVSSAGPLHGHDLEFEGETEAEAWVSAWEAN